MPRHARRLVDRKTRLTCFEALARGLNAGVDAADSLRIAADSSSGRVAVDIRKAATRIAGGGAIALALRDHGLATSFEVELVRLGERHGSLETILTVIAERYQRTFERTRRLKGKLLLPGFVFIVGLFVGPLPALASGALDTVGYALRIALPLLSIASLGAAAIWLAKRAHNRHGGRVAGSLTSMPLVGGLLLNYSRAEFLERLNLFEQAGYPIIEASDDVASSLPGLVRLERYRHIGSDLRSGMSLADSLRRHGVLDNDAFAIVSSGEAGGQLAGMLDRAAGAARQRFEQHLGQLVTWLPRFVYALVAGFVLSQVL